jgi:tetratricopeptide (TPR) repeat protein
MSFKKISLLKNIGSVYYRRARYDQALRYYNEALKINPNDDNIKADLAGIRRDLERSSSLSSDDGPGTIALKKGYNRYRSWMVIC